jgi:hypothetical protein
VSEGQAVFAFSLVVPGVVGFVVGRWWLLLLGSVVWLGIAVFLVVNDGWYGHGWGDFGEALTVLWALATLLSATVGIVARRVVVVIRRLRDEAGP